MASDRIERDSPILLAESHPIYLAAFRRLFDEFQMHNITATGNGFRVVQLSKERRFDLIVLGNILSFQDGTRVLRTLREKGGNTSTPLIFSYELKREEKAARQASSEGASAIFPKPPEEEPLREIIENLLGKQIYTKTEERERIDESMKPMFQAIRFGKKLRLEGELKEAESAFLDGLVEVFCGLAEIYLSKSDQGKAERILEEAVHINSKAREIFGLREYYFIERGREYINKKRFLAARVEFEAALTLNEDNVHALVGLGETLHCMEDGEGARAAFKQAITLKRGAEDPQVYKRLGLLSSRNRDYEIAVEAFDRAISYFPSDPENYYNLAVVRMVRGEPQKTLALLRKSLSVNPGFFEARRLLQKIEKWMGKSEKAESPEPADEESVEVI